jgi:P27 family predicted phage terminase small subunit
MAVTGRKPKPTAAKRLAGNPGKRPLNQGEPQFLGPKPRKPAGLPYYASVFWDKLAGPLYENGLLTVADVPVFEGLCYTFHFMKEAAKILKSDGQITTDEKGLKRKHPANQLFRDNYKLLMQAAAEFGISPSSRSRMDLGLADGDESLAEVLFSMVKKSG